MKRSKNTNNNESKIIPNRDDYKEQFGSLLGRINRGGHGSKIVKSKADKKLKTFTENHENMDWVRWAWDPVTGCEHGCDYCYSRDITQRIYTEGFKPTFRPESLSAPENTIPPESTHIKDRSVFVCPNGDLFGDWVPQEWIDAVLESVAKSHQWNFIFMTKNPERLVDIEWPENVWVGATVDTQNRVERTEEAFNSFDATSFISFEPLLEPITLSVHYLFSWFIIGARNKTTKVSELQPKIWMVKPLIDYARKYNQKIYCRPNLKNFITENPLREYPEDEHLPMHPVHIKLRQLGVDDYDAALFFGAGSRDLKKVIWDFDKMPMQLSLVVRNLIAHSTWVENFKKELPQNPKEEIV